MLFRVRKYLWEILVLLFVECLSVFKHSIYIKFSLAWVFFFSFQRCLSQCFYVLSHRTVLSLHIKAGWIKQPCKNKSPKSRQWLWHIFRGPGRCDTDTCKRNICYFCVCEHIWDLPPPLLPLPMLLRFPPTSTPQRRLGLP